MNTSEPPHPPLTEDDVDRLLTRFFECEVPAELRSPRLVLSPAPRLADTSRSRGASRVAAVILPVGLLCCLLGVALLAQPETPHSSKITINRMLPASPDEFAFPRNPATETPMPGVEDHSHSVPARTAVENPPQPPEIEVMIPELDVELFPPPPSGRR